MKAAPERLVWASDWPHPTEKADAKPDDAVLFDLMADWAPDKRPATASWSTTRRRCTNSTDRAHGQMYLPPSGALKQPTDSGNSVFGSHSTTFGKKIANAIVAKKIT